MAIKWICTPRWFWLIAGLVWNLKLWLDVVAGSWY